ncbi:uncharacterized protein BDR25DRAFT_302661 [Lindgomyces ingoldianus]|uniref:Uncharacterized protein n=1 Tax=Lindgomyces ingoldianus TaxID=673940 RepID=A0ACB6R2E9_9PLEO|nr:uncharacterized protein BDR25DRAFT_302661 [Lindgomyces ingoldianus]KAF2472507.1 hypothetical protein BDR25DRAFT_302661 [Lindgomyces ingoldianus]
MADVRSMLRQERAARQQTGRLQKQSAAPAAAPTSRKRKATGDSGEERKRTRTEQAKGVPTESLDSLNDPPVTQASTPNAADVAQTSVAEAGQPPIPEELTYNPPQPQLTTADEDDLDAFIKEMEEAPLPQHTLPGYSGAVIEGAPMTAAELAAQAREEQSAQRGRREEELEAEKEDAARQLEVEFEDMDELEERVRKLREKREALRNAQAQTDMEGVVIVVPEPVNMEDESDSDDEDWDDWRFRLA